MVLREAFPDRGGLLDQVGVIAGLRPEEGGFQQPLIPDAVGTAVVLDLVRMRLVPRGLWDMRRSPLIFPDTFHVGLTSGYISIILEI